MKSEKQTVSVTALHVVNLCAYPPATIIHPMKHIPAIFFLAAFLLTSCGPASSAETASDSPAAYIENKGSDTIVNLALAWAERYQAEHPEIRISVTGGGSGTGIASLINGTVDIA